MLGLQGLLGCESIGIMSLARVARRAASERSSVDMLLPTSSVSGTERKQSKAQIYEHKDERLYKCFKGLNKIQIQAVWLPASQSVER